MDKYKSDDLKIKDRMRTTTLSTAYNIVLQIGLRLFSFGVNGFILRYISKKTLGIINVRLLLLYTTIQFITREPFRRTCTPNNKVSNGDSQEEKENETEDEISWNSVVNITFLSIPVSFIIGFLFSMIWYNLFDRPEQVLNQYQWAIFSILISVIIESIAETCFVYGQRNDYIRLKVFVEAIFHTTRCSLIAFFVYLYPEHSILGFAIAQLLSSTLYTIVYFVYFINIEKIKLIEFIPTYIKNEPTNNFDQSLIKIYLVFLKNSIYKQFLTEGERYIMTMFSVIGFAEQGIYDVINNLGSLPARLIFQQIEENAYLLFSSLINRNFDINRQKSKILKSLAICTNMVKLMFLIGLLLFIYGFNAANLTLHIYGGSKFLADEFGPLAIKLFQCHCIYILFIALNGILEAYSFSVMNAAQLNEFNSKMLKCSILFIINSLLITRLIGSAGFIMANCINMLTRIIISLRFIGNIHSEYSIIVFIRNSMPKFLTLISYAIVFILLTMAQSSLIDPLTHVFTIGNAFLFIAFNATLLMIHLLCIYYLEPELKNFVRQEIFDRSIIKTKIN